MAKFQGGLDEIIKALNLMNSSEREVLLGELSKRDPEMALKIKNSLVKFEDIQYLTPKMLVEFLREISIKDLGLSLRLDPDPNFKRWLFENLPKSIRLEIIDILDGPKVKKSDVLEAQTRIMSTFRTMVDQGKLVISKSDDYV